MEARSDCLEACSEAARTCLRTVTYCLRWGGPLSDCAHLLTLLGCAQACRRAAEELAKGGTAAELLLACARTCDECARACERFDDLELRECSALCRCCAPICRRAVLDA